MKNQALICEQALTSVGAVGDLVTSPLLVELAEVESANASAYLKAQTSKGRLELIGKTVHTEGKKKVYVYRVKEEFFKIPARSKCAELNFARCGGAKGRTWETQDLPEIFI